MMENNNGKTIEIIGLRGIHVTEGNCASISIMQTQIHMHATYPLIPYILFLYANSNCFCFFQNHDSGEDGF